MNPFSRSPAVQVLVGSLAGLALLAAWWGAVVMAGALRRVWPW